MPASLGVFGGTFDPPHRGHLAVARAARSTLGLDAVHFVVANDPWQKADRHGVTAAVDRLALVQAMVADEEGLVADDCEIRRGGASYTIDTVREFGERFPGATLHLLIGRDLVEGFATWHEAWKIGRLVRMVVLDRPGYSSPLPQGWTSLAVPQVDVSSTEVRDALLAGRDVGDSVAPAVLREIRVRGLYQSAVLS